MRTAPATPRRGNANRTPPGRCARSGLAVRRSVVVVVAAVRGAGVGWWGTLVPVGRPRVADATSAVVGRRGAPGVSRARSALEWVNGRRTETVAGPFATGGISGDHRRPSVRSCSSDGRGNVRERFPNVNRTCACGGARKEKDGKRRSEKPVQGDPPTRRRRSEILTTHSRRLPVTAAAARLCDETTT